MSVVDQVGPRLRELLERFGFDAAGFEMLRERVASGELSAARNVVAGELEPLRGDELARLPAPGDSTFAETGAIGRAAIGRGEVAAAVLNGGMATRLGGVVKGLLEAVDGRSFLEWKLEDASRAGAPLAVMTSFASDAPTRAALAGLDCLVFPQSVSLRLNPDGTLFREDRGSASPYSPGHGDFPSSLRRSGVLDELRSRGVKTIVLSNVDNLGARIDPLVVGAHLLAGRPVTAEVTAKRAGDAGGAPARVNGRPVAVEGFRFPEGFDQETIPVFATNTLLLELDALDPDYPLSWLYVEKEVDGRPAVQLERLVNELTWVLPTTFLEVPRDGPRGRFFPVKTPEDLERIRPALRELVRHSPLS